MSNFASDDHRISCGVARVSLSEGIMQLPCLTQACDEFTFSSPHRLMLRLGSMKLKIVSGSIGAGSGQDERLPESPPDRSSPGLVGCATCLFAEESGSGHSRANFVEFLGRDRRDIVSFTVGFHRFYDHAANEGGHLIHPLQCIGVPRHGRNGAPSVLNSGGLEKFRGCGKLSRRVRGGRIFGPVKNFGVIKA